MSDSCSVHDGGCSNCGFGQRLAALNEDGGEEWPVVMVRFRESSRTRFFAPGDFHVQANDWVIVETSRGEEAGKVIATPQQVRAAVFAGPLKPVHRLAHPWEVELVGQLEGEAKRAMLVFREHIARHELPMKPIRAEYSFDGKRLTFYYSAEGRVDFRSLVRDLAQHFGLRIDLRQVGVRDEARLVGGVGKCGRSLCCSSWLQTYPSVTLRQAKEQDLPLNPTKISGACGRLLCCLSYENDQYVEMKRELPRLGQFVPTPQGTGKVIGLHTLKGTVVLYVEGAGVQEYPASELRQLAGADAAARAAARSGTGPQDARGGAPIQRADAAVAGERSPAAPAPAAGDESPRGGETAVEPLDAETAQAGPGPVGADRPRRSRRRTRRGGRRQQGGGE